jgi:RNA polymerase sigma factor (sigma-70 family)
MSPRISISLLSAQSDQRLLALARDGHERAFEALVQRYRRPLLRYCRGMRLADARAEDVLQQAFLQVWLALARGAEVRELRPWLYRIVHNVAVNALRAAGEPHGELTDAVQADAALARESNLERTIAVREALGEVAELPRMQRQAIFLTAVDGQTHDEVASTLGITEGALRGLLYRARATLRSAAAALTPPPLLEWAARGAGATPTAELTAGGAATGFAGVLLKGAVVAVTAGALATGASVVAGDKSAAPAQHAALSESASTPSIASAPTAPSEVLQAGALGSMRLVTDRSRARRRGGDRRHRSKGTERKHRSRGGSGTPDGSGSGSGSAQGLDGAIDTSGRNRGDGGKPDDGSDSSSGSSNREQSDGGGREALSSGDGSGTSGDRFAGKGSGSTGASGRQASGGSASNSGSSASGSSKESGMSVTPVIDNSTASGSLGGERASDVERASGGPAGSSNRGRASSDG